MLIILYLFFFKQKTAYEMRISDWSSDVCSSDLLVERGPGEPADLEIDAHAVDQHAVAIVKPRLGGVPCRLDRLVRGQQRRAGDVIADSDQGGDEKDGAQREPRADRKSKRLNSSHS